jgi:hypothetical protein
MRAHVAAVLLFLAIPAWAADKPADKPCSTPEYRQFDFWVGDWVVRGPAGKEAGRNRIEKSNDGCVLHERWTSVTPYRGESLNLYDAPRKVWHQTWVDNTGLLLTIEGGLKDGAMVLEGERPGKDGPEHHRITWTPGKDGSTLRQQWHVSADGGKTWNEVFDGRYSRR